MKFTTTAVHKEHMENIDITQYNHYITQEQIFIEKFKLSFNTDIFISISDAKRQCSINCKEQELLYQQRNVRFSKKPS